LTSNRADATLATSDGKTSLDRPDNVDLVTGSSVVNGTVNEILERFEAAGKPVVFFGSTIAGVAALLKLDRVCPFAR